VAQFQPTPLVVSVAGGPTGIGEGAVFKGLDGEMHGLFGEIGVAPKH
jgi:hypothetical protein